MRNLNEIWSIFRRHPRHRDIEPKNIVTPAFVTALQLKNTPTVAFRVYACSTVRMVSNACIIADYFCPFQICRHNPALDAILASIVDDSSTVQHIQ